MKDEYNYNNLEIENEVQDKGFTVYNYISVDELLLTVRKDYLDILSVINVPFGIVSVFMGIISYFSGAYFLLFLFLFIVYSIIFAILFVKLLKKTYHFLLISDVVFTRKGIIFGDKLYSFLQNDALDEKLKYYETVFLEYLGGKSRLEDYIHAKKKDLIIKKGKGKTSKGLSQILEDLPRGSGSSDDFGKLILVGLVSYGIYVVFLYVSYYVGYFLGILFMKIYAFFIRGILFFRDSYELKIKKSVTGIDEDIVKMNQVYHLLAAKYEKFSQGEISDISKFTHRNFENFYTEIFSVYEKKKRLEKLILEGKYKDFIDFSLFEAYLKKSFNKPVKAMIAMLKTHIGHVEKQIQEISKIDREKDGLGGTLESKDIILKNNLDILTVNIKKLEKSLI